MIPTTRIALDTLRDRISEGITANVKSYNVPAICVRVGIQEVVEPTDADEAFKSRRVYVKSRILQLDMPALLKIAAAVLNEFEVPKLTEVVSELTVHATHRITEVTRRDTLKILNRLDKLFNDIDLFEGLNIISSERLSRETIGMVIDFLPSRTRDIVQHYIRNPDYSAEDLLILCDALTCPQASFFALLEKLLHPVIRRGDEQTELAVQLNAVLRPDGFQAVVVGEQSLHPIYAIRRIVTGVAGAVKNLIFASVGKKPELVLRDAINNDVEITKHAELCLVFDQPLRASGMAWVDMVEWWQAREGLTEPKTARKSLGERLTRTVEFSNSPGEYAIFRTYYEVFGPKLGQ